MPFIINFVVYLNPASDEIETKDIRESHLNATFARDGGTFVPLRKTSTSGRWMLPGYIEIADSSRDLYVVLLKEDGNSVSSPLRMENGLIEASLGSGIEISASHDENLDSNPCKCTMSMTFVSNLPIGLSDKCNMKDYHVALNEATSRHTGEDPLSMLYHSACFSLASFSSSRDRIPLNDALSTFQEFAEKASDDHPDMPDALQSLAAILSEQATLVGDLSYLRRAVPLVQKAIDLIPPDNTSKMSKYHMTLGLLTLSLFEATGNDDDIDISLSAYAKAVHLCSEHHESDLHHALSSLGNAFYARSLKSDEMEDIERAIEATQEALRQGGLESPNSVELISNLGMSLMRRFERTGNQEDIDRTVQMNQAAVILGEEILESELPSLLNNLSMSLSRRYRYSGNIGDLQDAISTQQRSVFITGEGNAGLPARLVNLGTLLDIRYKTLNDPSDNDDAITYQKRGVDLTPPGDSRLPIRLSNLGLSYVSQYVESHQNSSLVEAATCLRRALELIEKDHPHRTSILANLGYSLLNDEASSTDITHATETIEVLEEANALTPDDHYRKTLRLDNLASAIKTRFHITGDLQDLEQCISLLRKALELTPEQHAWNARRLLRMASLHRLRHNHSQAESDRESAIEFYRKAATLQSTSPPSDRLDAARGWISLAYARDRETSLPAFEVAIGLIPLVADLGTTMSARGRALADTSEVILHGASVALSLDEPQQALQWLEQSRCLIWGQLNTLRTPLDQLRIHDEKLADQLLELSTGLQRLGSRDDLFKEIKQQMSMSEKMSLQGETATHVSLAREWDKTIQSVREIPGFENFLLPPPIADMLTDLPQDGPTILINAYQDQCDALALVPDIHGPGALIHIPLPNLTQDKMDRMAALLRKDLLSANLVARGSVLAEDGENDEPTEEEEPRGFAPRRPPQASKFSPIVEVLRELWIELVKPILDALAFSPSPAAPTRTWWCTTGSLSFLPIHAAGIYSGPESVAGESTISDYVISSYIPSLTTLTQRVKRTKVQSHGGGGLLLVSQPNAPGLPHIPGTVTEIRAIEAQLANSGIELSVLEGSNATVKNGVENMKKCSSIHLACHGIQDSEDALDSGFFMYDDRLTISKIAEGQIANAGVAFLSACQTSAGDPHLPEEALHLTAGMLAAGYQSAVGTMWSIQDAHAPLVAEEFYKHLVAESSRSTQKLDPSKSALALHHAILALRTRLGTSDPSAFLAWVPYVHYGL